ncbi:MAG: hypothetical protein ABSB35_14310 [Bryobacteraceae bacterium]
MKSGRLLGWWYVCIGLGFGALAARNLLAGAPRWSIVLRVFIAAGFLLLGVGSLRSPDAKSRRQ